jgi:septal ring factor EnvC (AmiA/AmiB activator)
MEKATHAAARPAAALADVKRFIDTAHQLKSVSAHLADRRARRSRLEFVLAEQIKILTQHCAELASSHPQLADLWKQTQRELESATPAAPAVPHTATRLEPCAPGARTSPPAP